MTHFSFEISLDVTIDYVIELIKMNFKNNRIKNILLGPNANEFCL